MYRFQLAALYTLQHGLTCDAQQASGLLHGNVSGWCLFQKAFSKLFIDPNLPGSTGSDLFPGDKAICQPSMDCGRSHSQNLSCFLDGDQLSRRWIGWGAETRNLPMTAKSPDPIGRERKSSRSLLALPAEDPGDQGIGVMLGQTADQSQGIFIGAGNGCDAAIGPKARRSARLAISVSAGLGG